MCAIAGLVDYNNNINNDTILKMLDTMKRRGPDASGIYKSENTCILHSRLIVVDPENGKQPMIYDNGDTKYILTYNGELYNTEEIRRELVLKGYSFTGHSDTEVLLKAYAEWGSYCLQKLNGIFAFAVWNEKEQTLFMARDRIGVKPFFFYEYKDGIIFASEIKTLLANPKIKPAVDKDGLNEIFLLGPARTGGNGIFKNICELKPGEYGVFNRYGVKKRTYWSLKAAPHTDNLSRTIEKTRYLITDSIKRQLVSDVPLCCFLSGGLDSSIISAVAAAEYKERGTSPLTTYSVDYEDNQKYFQKSLFQPNSDSSYIEMMREYIRSSHRNVVLENTQLVEALHDAVCARDLPGMTDIDSSLLLFCGDIKKDFTVALSGECADEIFGGYPWYHNEDMLFENTFPWSRSISIRKMVIKDGVLGGDADEYVHSRYMDTVNSADKLPTDSKIDSRIREMFMLNFYWFMQTLLDRKDRMSMYNGLEVRVPFCDYRIAEYAYNMPWHLKSLEGREKGIVREAVKDLLPHEIIWRKKSPYPKTFHPEYFEIVKNKVFNLLNDNTTPLPEMLSKKTLIDFAQEGSALKAPWYGQLMGLPQIFAYIYQIYEWIKEYNVEFI